MTDTGTAKQKRGDNCYQPLGNGEFRQLPSCHYDRKIDREDPRQKAKDLRGDKVLVAKRFTYFSGAPGRRENVSQEAGAKLKLRWPSVEISDGTPCPAVPEGATDVGGLSPALLDLVLELEERAAMRRGTGAEVSVTGDHGVGLGTAGQHRDLVGHSISSDEAGEPVRRGEEVTPRSQGPPGVEATQAGDEPAAELPDEGRRRSRDSGARRDGGTAAWDGARPGWPFSRLRGETMAV